MLHRIAKATEMQFEVLVGDQKRIRMGIVIILIGLFWLVCSKPLSVFTARYYEALKMPLMNSKEWRIIIIFAGLGACLFGTLVLSGVIKLTHDL